VHIYCRTPEVAVGSFLMESISSFIPVGQKHGLMGEIIRQKWCGTNGAARYILLRAD